MTHPDPPKQMAAKMAHGTDADPGRAIADALTRDQDALQGDMEAIGRDFRKAVSPMLAAAERIREQMAPHACPDCSRRYITAVGLKAHYNAEHSWWWRFHDAFVDLFTTTIFMPRWAAIAAVAALSAAAAIGWWTR